MAQRLLATVALAVTQLSLATAAGHCGWFGEKCCNIAPNNPNVGDCADPRNVCWEGICMDCGTNGKIKCPTEPVCEAGFLLNADGWCYTDPNGPGNHNCNGECGHGTVCFYGRCEACGNNGQPKCDEGAECGNGLVVNQDGFCETAPHCGWQNEQCCPGDKCLAEGTECQNGKCMIPTPQHCGWQNEQCCPGDKCLAEGTECQNGKCTIPTPQHCGWQNEQCCPGDQCLADETACVGGKCIVVPILPGPSECGWQNEQCCPGNECVAEGTACVGGKCMVVPILPGACGARKEQCCPGNVCHGEDLKCKKGKCILRKSAKMRNLNKW